MNQVYSVVMIVAVVFVLTAPTTAYATKPAVTVSNNGTLIANPLPTNSTGNMTDPPRMTITPIPRYSDAWNAGYAHGYLGDNLTGTHTKNFFFGYLNGTHDLLWNVGYACGVSGKIEHYHWHNKPFCERFEHDRYEENGKVFISGNITGWKDRIDMQNGYWPSDARDHLRQITLPVNTTDGYRDYFVGFANGVRTYDYDTPHTIDNVFTAPCNGTAEYCTGFKAGWNEDDSHQD